MKEQLTKLFNFIYARIIQEIVVLSFLSIKGVLKLYSSDNLIPYFDLFKERKTCLCLSLHKYPLFGFI